MNTIAMEPFSTSVFKVHIWIFATTTKICTKGISTQAHAKSFHKIVKTIHLYAFLLIRVINVTLTAKYK